MLGAVLVALVAGGGAFGIGQFALAVMPWTWLRLLIVLLFVAPAAVAGYSATHGLAQMAVPSAAWRTVFSIVGAIAVSITAFVRFTGMSTSGRLGRA